MEEGQVTTAVDADHPYVLVVTVDRLPVNALNPGQYRRITQVFESLVDRPEIRCAILTGAGDRVFIGGADVKQLSTRTVEGTIERSVLARRAFAAVRECAVPVVAAVNGSAVGAGFVFATCCDLMVSSARAKFALPEIDVGVLGGTRHVSRVVPGKLLRLLALTGRRIGPEVLERFGAVHEIVPPGEVMAAAFRLADEISTKSPAIVRLMKESINLTESMPLNDGYRVEQLFTTLATELPDSKEAALAFLEKRAARYD